LPWNNVVQVITIQQNNIYKNPLQTGNFLLGIFGRTQFWQVIYPEFYLRKPWDKLSVLPEIFILNRII